LKAELGDFQTLPALVAEILKSLSISNKYCPRVFQPTCGIRMVIRIKFIVAKIRFI